MEAVPPAPRLGRAVRGAAAAWLVGLVVAVPVAEGHAAFLSSRPPPGARAAASPRLIVLTFSEPLNGGLSGAKVVEARSGRQVPGVQVSVRGTQLRLRPRRPLRKAAYVVRWRSVSTDDGHPLEGSFSIGVGTAAVGGARSVETGPFARGGWLVAGERAAFYVALLLFCGGLLAGLLVSRRERPVGWLFPEELDGAFGIADGAARARRRLADLGWLATALAAGLAAAEAFKAGGTVSARVLDDYLFTSTSGVARLITVALLGVAAATVRRRPVAAGLSAAAALVGVALAGHANSAEPRALAVWSDAIHLIAGSVWLGGLAWLALTWAPRAMRSERTLRLAVMRHVLEPFGRIALPAFALVAAAGVVNVLVELGSVQALWQTSYGAVLATKMLAVGLVALLSYTHALRIRPKLLAANPHPPGALERRHWRLIRSEPLVALLVPLAGALLAAFPLPPRQLGDTSAGPAVANHCGPCPIRRPRPDELAVAEQAGGSIAAVWIRRTDSGLTGRFRLYGLNRDSPKASARIAGARQKACGPACWDFELATQPSSLVVRVADHGETYVARLPSTWRVGADARARRLLVRAQRTMQRVASVRDDNVLTSGPGTSTLVSRYLLEAPDRALLRIGNGTDEVFIGRWEWDRDASGRAWRRQRFGGGGPPFRTRSWFRWTAYSSAVRLVSVERGLAELALIDPADTPIWYRLWIDVASKRVVRTRMVAGGHFMNDRFSHFGEPARIAPPTSDAVAR